MTRERVTLKTPLGSASIAYDAVLVLIGSIPPWDVPRGAGVRTVAEGPAEAEPKTA